MGIRNNNKINKCVPRISVFGIYHANAFAAVIVLTTEKHDIDDPKKARATNRRRRGWRLNNDDCVNALDIFHLFSFIEFIVALLNIDCWAGGWRCVRRRIAFDIFVQILSTVRWLINRNWSNAASHNTNKLNSSCSACITVVDWWRARAY